MCDRPAIRERARGGPAGSGAVRAGAGDAGSADWSFELTTKPGPDGGVDVGGPFEMFRRAKLHMADIDPGLLARVADGEGTLVARVALTDDCGLPVCARARPPTITWTLA